MEMPMAQAHKLCKESDFHFSEQLLTKPGKHHLHSGIVHHVRNPKSL